MVTVFPPLFAFARVRADTGADNIPADTQKDCSAATWGLTAEQPSWPFVRSCEGPVYLVGKSKDWPTKMRSALGATSWFREYRSCQLLRPWAWAILNMVSPALTV
jgi:hypothetical protein